MSKYDARLRKLEDRSVDLMKVFACPYDHLDPVRGVPHQPCSRDVCECAAAEMAHLTATRGRGVFVLVDGKF